MCVEDGRSKFFYGFKYSKEGKNINETSFGEDHKILPVSHERRKSTTHSGRNQQVRDFLIMKIICQIDSHSFPTPDL